MNTDEITKQYRSPLSSKTKKYTICIIFGSQILKISDEILQILRKSTDFTI